MYSPEQIYYPLAESILSDLYTAEAHRAMRGGDFSLKAVNEQVNELTGDHIVCGSVPASGETHAGIISVTKGGRIVGGRMSVVNYESADQALGVALRMADTRIEYEANRGEGD